MRAAGRLRARDGLPRRAAAGLCKRRLPRAAPPALTRGEDSPPHRGNDRDFTDPARVEVAFGHRGLFVPGPLRFRVLVGPSPMPSTLSGALTRGHRTHENTAPARTVGTAAEAACCSETETHRGTAADAAGTVSPC